MLLFLIACGGNNNNSNITAPTPMLNLLPATAEVVLGKSATFTVTATNTDFTLTGDGCSKNNSTTVVCTPTKVGTYDLTVTSTANTTLARKATITVVEVNIAIAADSDESEIMVGESKIFTVTATNTEYNMSVEDEAGCIINENNASEIICTPTATGGYNLVVTAKADTSKTANATFSTYEVGISIAPSQAVIVLGHSETFTVATARTDFHMDVDSAAGCVASGNEIICTPTAAGEYRLTVTATADTTKTMTSDITINEVGVTIDPSTKSVTVGEPAVFTVTALNTGFDLFIADEDKDVAGCTVSGDEIICTPTAAGNYKLTLITKEDTNKTAEAILTATEPGPIEVKGMVFVKVGTFTMGCDPIKHPTNCTNSGSTSAPDAMPQHEVTLTQDFYIGKTEVTQKQWNEIMDIAPDANPSAVKGDDFPVTNIHWDEIHTFIDKLNERGEQPTGMKWALPTEAQWEYAARGGAESQGYIYAGSNDPIEVAWHYSNSGANPSAPKQVHPVGQLSPNELGIFDMSGNVREIIADGTRAYTEVPEENPVGNPMVPPSMSPDEPICVMMPTFVFCTPSGPYFMMRGGDYTGLGNTITVWLRSLYLLDVVDSTIGFRLALVPDTDAPNP